MNHQLYFSNRGIPLLYTGPLQGKTILTAENYMKWYSLQLLHPDGRVEDLPVEAVERAMDKPSKQLWIDHNFHPDLFEILEGQLDVIIDDSAHEMAAGRWALEYGLPASQ